MKQVVEYQGIPVGVLIQRDGCLAFMAVKYDVIELDGRSFLSAAEARAAIRAHVTQRDGGLKIPMGRGRSIIERWTVPIENCSHSS